MVASVVVYGRLNVNVALNRPTFASSVFSGLYGSFPASKAVDGNKDTNAEQVGHSCFNSLPEANPWMSVDLGAALAVVGVHFTNRGDCCGNLYLCIQNSALSCFSAYLSLSLLFMVSSVDNF